MTVIWFLCFALYLIALLPASLYMKILTKQGKIEKRNAIVRKMARKLVLRMSRLAGVKYDIQGLENVPKEGNAIYIANHQGIFDIAVMMLIPREVCGFLVKKEAEKIPLARKWLLYVGCIFVDREKPRDAVEALNIAEERVKNGESMVIFPEGTRSKTGEIGEFKNGAFRIAKNTGVQVIPVAIEGTYKVWEQKHKISKATVKARVLPPIQTEGMTKEEYKLIGEKVRQLIVDAKPE